MPARHRWSVPPIAAGAVKDHDSPRIPVETAGIRAIRGRSAVIGNAGLNKALCIGLLLLAVCAGCSRTKYFRQADQEVESLLNEKSDDPRWCLPQDYSVYLDPRSRYYEPYSEICPPMPPDDPASHRFMHYVDSKKGSRYWHVNGDRPDLENPGWRARIGEYAPLSDQGAIKLSLPTAMTVARINSSEHQEPLETIYLSALDVSTERFRFDVQFYGGIGPSFTATGKDRPSGSGVERNRLAIASEIEARRKFATAGELLVGFANSITWQFAGSDSYANLSLLNFSLVQPLLRGAGRQIALEQLTIAERNLLANLRALQRFRQGYYVRVAIGDANVTGPTRRGGFGADTGISGFTGTGATGLGGVGTATNYGTGTGGAQAAGSGSGGTGFAGGGAGAVGGFIGLLQQLQQTRNQEGSLYLQLRTLGLLEAHLEAGTLDLQQVDQFRQNIETGRATLLQSRNALADALDTYKTSILGIPPDIPVDLDDALIRQFQFIDPAMSQVQNRLSDYRQKFGLHAGEPEFEVLRGAVAELADLCKLADGQFPLVADDLKRTREAVPTREKPMAAAEQKQYQADLTRLDETHAALLKRAQLCGKRVVELQQSLSADKRKEAAHDVVVLSTELNSVLDELSLVQARARMEAVILEHESLPSEAALEIARANRLDWMNRRASLVDTWRLVEFNANKLQSELSLTVAGDMYTTGNSPARFSAPTGQMRVGLQFDAPFTRLLERNNFRQSIIDYERERRKLVQFEDSVHQSLRTLLRDLEQLHVNLEIQRRAVAIAIRRVDQTREVLNEPPPPPQPGQPTVQLGSTAALNLLTAMNDLSSSQNNLMSVWLNYKAVRMRLARELGTMQIDDNGMWVEQPMSLAERMTAEEAPLPPPVPREWVKAVDADASDAPAERAASPRVPTPAAGPSPAEAKPEKSAPKKPVFEPLPPPPAPLPQPSVRYKLPEPEYSDEAAVAPTPDVILTNYEESRRARR